MIFSSDTMSRKPLTTYENFSEARQDFDQILVVNVSYVFCTNVM
jgi:hypothetical protein